MNFLLTIVETGKNCLLKDAPFTLTLQHNGYEDRTSVSY